MSKVLKVPHALKDVVAHSKKASVADHEQMLLDNLIAVATCVVQSNAKAYTENIKSQYDKKKKASFGSWMMGCSASDQVWDHDCDSMDWDGLVKIARVSLLKVPLQECEAEICFWQGAFAEVTHHISNIRTRI